MLWTMKQATGACESQGGGCMFTYLLLKWAFHPAKSAKKALFFGSLTAGNFARRMMKEKW